MSMPESPRISGEAFAVDRLRDDPDLDYGAIRKLAAAAGVSLAPIQYGRARRQLGLPPLRGPRAAGAATRAASPTTKDDGTPAGMDDDADDDSDRAGSGSADDGSENGGGGGSGDASDGAVDLVAPRRKGSPAFDFLLQALRREPHASYGELKRRADGEGHKIAPIMYGRAKAMLGLVPVKPRGQSKQAKAKAEAAATAAANAAPRVLRQVESVAADRFAQKLEEVRNVEQLVSIVKDLDAERRRLRMLLDRIVTMIDEALG